MKNTFKALRGEPLRDALWEAFGDVEDYFTEEESSEKEGQWESDRDAVALLLADYIENRQVEALAEAQRIEGEWGATPLCDAVEAELTAPTGAFSVGTLIEAGEGEDHDEGEVLSYRSDGYWVAWKSGTRTVLPYGYGSVRNR